MHKNLELLQLPIKQKRYQVCNNIDNWFHQSFFTEWKTHKTSLKTNKYNLSYHIDIPKYHEQSDASTDPWTKRYEVACSPFY